MATMFSKLFQSSFRILLQVARGQGRNGVIARRYSRSGKGKPKVFLARKMNPATVECLKKHCDVEIWDSDEPVPRDELLKKVVDKEGLFFTISDRIDREVIDAGRVLKVIATMSVGFDHIDVPAALQRNIRIGNAPGAVRNSTAEMTTSLALIAGRRLFEAREATANGGWSAWKPFWMCGQGFDDMTVGIVGAGAIGTEVMRQVLGFRPKQLLYYNIDDNPDANELGAKRMEFHELLRQSDFVLVCISLAKETKGMFNEEAFKMMKKNCVFVNTSRGGVVDQDALIKALEEKTIAAAGLDVTTPEPLPLESPLFKFKNCIILPHAGTSTYKAREDMAMMTAENIINGLKGNPMHGEVKG